MNASISGSKHDPDRAYIFRIGYDLYSHCHLHLVSLGEQDVLPVLVAVNMVHHLLCVEVGKLHWKGFECVTLRHVILNALLEFFISKGAPTDSFLFIINEGSWKEIRQVVVPAGGEVFVSHAHWRYLVLQNALDGLLILRQICKGRRH